MLGNDLRGTISKTVLVHKSETLHLGTSHEPGSTILHMCGGTLKQVRDEMLSSIKLENICSVHRQDESVRLTIVRDSVFE